MLRVMARVLYDTKPLPEAMLTYCREQTLVKFESKYKHFHSRDHILKRYLQHGGLLYSCLDVLKDITRAPDCHNTGIWHLLAN